MDAQPRDREQVRDRLRELAVPVDELGDGRDVLVGGRRGEALVGLEAQPLLGDVVVRTWASIGTGFLDCRRVGLDAPPWRYSATASPTRRT